jgi:hypothetical protein
VETSLNVLLGASANIQLVWFEELGIVNEIHKKYLPPNYRVRIYLRMKCWN